MKNIKKWVALALIAAVFGGIAGAAVDQFKIANHNIFFGQSDTVDKKLIFNNNAGSGNPQIRMHLGALEFSTDGVLFFQFSAGIPIGGEMSWPTETPPAGWLMEDGTAVSRATYAALFAVIGVRYGIGDGTTTFNVPDKRGVVERMWDDASGFDVDVASRTNYSGGVFGGSHTITADSNSNTTLTNLSAADCANVSVGMLISGGDMPGGTFVTATDCPGFDITISNPAGGTNPAEVLTLTNSAYGRYVGSWQGDMFGSHNHLFTVATAPGGTPGTYGATNYLTYYSGAYIVANGGSESRGKNIYTNKIIKF